MHMALKTKQWTFAELDRLPDDGNKYEVVHGELFVTPAPTDRHETILSRLTRQLDPYVRQENLGLVFHPRSVIRVPPDSQVEPDLMVRQPHPVRNGKWEDAPLPILVVEVLSDSTRRRDFTEKRKLYIDLGIPEYWIVDGEARTICVVRPGLLDTAITEGKLRWHPVGAADPLVIDLDDIFLL